MREIGLTSSSIQLGGVTLGKGVDYRALEERRNEALTKRLVVKIGNDWGEFKGEKRKDDTMNTVIPAAFLVLM